MGSISICVIFYICLLVVSAIQSKNSDILIWPKKFHGNHGPHALGISDEFGRISEVHVPSLTFHPTNIKNKKNIVVIIFPGGGYARLSYSKEGLLTAEWLNDHGIDVFILKYRHVPYHHPIPLLDAMQSVKFIRSMSSQFDISPVAVGVLGFSAGGHLAASLVTHFADPTFLKMCSFDSAVARPDFAGLIYPVISMESSLTHLPSQFNLLGKSPSKELIDFLSAEKNIEPNIPPIFLLHAADDRIVSVQNSLVMYQSLLQRNISSEMHIFPKGGHGFGVLKREDSYVGESWPFLFLDWVLFVTLGKQNMSHVPL